jgi:hypothetical protein
VRRGAALLEVPAEVDLGAGDPVLVVEGDDLGVTSPATAGDVAFIGDDDLIARFDHSDELKVLAPPRPGPAALKVTVTVELRVRRGGEEEVIAQALLEEASVPLCKRGIGVANNLLAVGSDPPSLVSRASKGTARRSGLFHND